MDNAVEYVLYVWLCLVTDGQRLL